MQVTALMAGKISSGAVPINQNKLTESGISTCACSASVYDVVVNNSEVRKLGNGHHFGARVLSSSKVYWCINGKPSDSMISRHNGLVCRSTSTHRDEVKECVQKSKDGSDMPSCQVEDDIASHFRHHQKLPRSPSGYSNQGLAEAFKFMYNDAKFVNERARNDIGLLSRGITRLNDRARRDVAVLGLGFLKLDARAREDTEKIDHGVKKKAARLHHVAMIVKDRAHSKLKIAADQHWSDGALEADLRRADFCMRRRAMEDAFMALKFVRDIHDRMLNKLHQQPGKEGSFLVNDVMGFITLEKNGKSLDIFAGEVSTDRVTAIQDAYHSMASALSQADGIDYTDPEELELLVATLIDLDAMDGKSSVSLLAECSSSPDVNTRQALANALAAAPSMWTLGNAGMGALQRLAEDSNPAVAAAASKAIDELKQQWNLEEGDRLKFMMNQHCQKDNVDETGTDTSC